MSLLQTQPQPHCMLCGENGINLYRGLTDTLFGVAGKWDLSRCCNPDCGLVWQNPMVIPNDLSKAYQHYYTHQAYTNARLSWWRRVEQRLYRQSERVLQRLTGLHTARQQAIQGFLHDFPRGKLLDVGCGNGAFLDQMQQRGWHVEGTDFDLKAAQETSARYGFNVQVGDLAHIGYPAAQFDAITLKHVIEHVPNPIALLQECWRILRPKGRLVVITPNVDSWGHQHYREYWRGLEQPRHLYLFSTRTLTQLAVQANLPQPRSFTTAAGAIYIFNESHHLQRLSKNQSASTASLLSPTWLWQYWEHYWVQRGRAIGEEAVLVVDKT